MTMSTSIFIEKLKFIPGTHCGLQFLAKETRNFDKASVSVNNRHFY